MRELLGFVPFSPRRAARLGAALAVMWGSLVGVPPATAVDAVLLAAGDISSCGNAGDTATAALLAGVPGVTIATLGDNVYPGGTAAQFTNCYEPTWGQHKARTRPVPGNHDYLTPGARGYFNYFGAGAGTPGQGWYSYDLGEWHVVALNSNCGKVGCGPNSEQVQWLRADLAAHANRCTVAYFHHPRFSSEARHGNDNSVRAFWDALYEYGADVVLSGHAHVYERFAPQDPAGLADDAYGIQQFVIGTGGASLYEFKALAVPNSEVRNATTHGILKLTLKPGSYGWHFLPEAGKTFTDAGVRACHGVPPAPPPTTSTSSTSSTTTTVTTLPGVTSSTTTLPGVPPSTTVTTLPAVPPATTVTTDPVVSGGPILSPTSTTTKPRVTSTSTPTTGR